MMDRPALSKGEMEVARVLWGLGSASVRQVHSALCSDRKIDFTTVQTYLRRLEAKGYAKARLADPVRMYAPRVKPRTVIRETVGDLIDRLFGGKAMPLMKHLIEEQGISDEDLEQLRELLDRQDEPQ